MLMIVDGNNLAHRCKHVFQLSNHGVDISVVFGFIKVLGSLMTKHKPSSVIVCWDGGIPEYRRQAVPEYKANRHVSDDPDDYEDFLRQMRELQDYALPMMGVVCVRKAGAEADDLMYHAAKISKEPAIIVTTDKDMLQTASENISILNPTKGILYTPQQIYEEFGIAVKDLTDWRAIQGDSSDNIPGVQGIGEKTATKLFQEYGSLTSIVNAALGHHPIHNMTGKVKDNIVTFGLERIVKNIYITALYADRTGSRKALLEAVARFVPADKIRVKKYFMHNAFVSLLEGSFFSSISKLEKPRLRRKNLRIPIILSKTRKSYGTA